MQTAGHLVTAHTSKISSLPEPRSSRSAVAQPAAALPQPKISTSTSTSLAHSVAEPSDLRPWQVHRLREQAASGRKNIKVKELCAKLQLGRAEVLHWLKEYEDVPPSPPPPKAPQYAHNSWGPPLQQAIPSGPVPTAKPTRLAPASFAGSKPVVQPSQQDWSSKGSKRLGGQARHTLDAILASTRWPEKQVIDEACLVHKVSRNEVMAYLAQRRKELQRPQTLR